jgi:hypothetical protein
MKNKNPLNRKDLKRNFEVLSVSYKDIENLLYIHAFALIIKPVADRYNWTIDWGMGSVSFITQNGKDLYDWNSNAVKKITEDLLDLLENITGQSKSGILWDVMSGLGDYNYYTKAQGLHKVTS